VDRESDVLFLMPDFIEHQLLPRRPIPPPRIDGVVVRGLRSCRGTATKVPIAIVNGSTAARANGGTVIIRNLGDAPRLIALYGKGEWVKKEFVDAAGYTVHWFENLTTGVTAEWKFTRVPGP
jgi:hypothetical protein